jgi:hypothetical protein
MRRIYSGAQMVRVWFSEPNIDETTEAVTALQHFGDYFDEHYEDYFVGKFRNDAIQVIGRDASFWRPVIPILKIHIGLECSNGFSCEAHTEQTLLESRIQQEVLNARRLTLHCMHIDFPGTSIEFSLHSYRLKYLWAFGWRDLFSHIPLHSAPAMDLSPYPQQQNVLTELLNNSGKLVMSDGHDRIYALMHLAKDYNDGGILVDYSKPAMNGLVDAAAYLVNKTYTLELLHSSILGADKDGLKPVEKWSGRPVCGASPSPANEEVSYKHFLRRLC